MLRHKRDSHPAHAAVRELAGRIDDLQRSQITQNSVISDLSREIERITREIELVSARRDRQRGRIEANEVPLRDISSMEHEIAQMETRLSNLEDDQLSVEEQRENAQKARESMLTEIEGMKASIEQTKAEFMAEVAEADDEMRTVIAKRRELAASEDPEPRREYTGKGGPGSSCAGDSGLAHHDSGHGAAEADDRQSDCTHGWCCQRDAAGVVREKQSV